MHIQCQGLRVSISEVTVAAGKAAVTVVGHQRAARFGSVNLQG